MDKLPSHSREGQKRQANPLFRLLTFSILISVTSLYYLTSQWGNTSSTVPINAAEIVQKCQRLEQEPGPPKDFHLRTQSDRFEAGTRATLLRNASIWTGRASGYEVIRGDVLLDKGLIKAVGHVKQSILDAYSDLVTVNVAGAWVTPG
jgi:hypothetical protein